MHFSPRDAAAQVGKSKSTILRAIQSGRLSAKRDDLGEYQVEASELFRVFEPVKHRTDAPHRTVTQDAPSLAPPDDAAVLRVKLEAAEAQLEQLKGFLDEVRGQRDQWQQQAERLSISSSAKPSIWKRLVG
jgi:hypothetical protein